METEDAVFSVTDSDKEVCRNAVFESEAESGGISRFRSTALSSDGNEEPLENKQQNAPSADAINEQPRRSRLKLFKKVMEKSLKKLTSDSSFQLFAHTFQPFYKQEPQMTQAIHRQFVKELKDSIEGDIKLLIEEMQLESALCTLDKLEQEAANQEEAAWRPSGVPEDDVSSILLPYYRSRLKELRKTVHGLEQENAQVAAKVLAQREEIMKKQQQISDQLEQWKDFHKAAENKFSPLYH
ncbi:polyamine-modulated factor 1 [Polypterus senegalus]|uniref:polyamine-modulated factor 1 n=1 Tax=Polypterus senegalus TaxID=55291 RepID=UPI001963E142|nr:polyamine-modulated factor 1 [Polypterus senegalus]